MSKRTKEQYLLLPNADKIIVVDKLLFHRLIIVFMKLCTNYLFMCRLDDCDFFLYLLKFSNQNMKLKMSAIILRLILNK